MKKELKTSKGIIHPLGATIANDGVNFAIASETAKNIFLCLFSDDGLKETQQIKLRKTEDVFHILIKDIKPGQLYGYRAAGEYSPENGLRFNKNKLLIDPYAKELYGEVNHNKANNDCNGIDNSKYIPKSVVKDDKFNWDDVKSPNIPLDATFIYEAHVKGLTMLHPDVPNNIKGKFLGMCHPAIIEHLKGLGVTTVELMPIQSFITEDFLYKKKLSNYWGYSPINYFSVHSEYGTIEEFKTLVKIYHENNIEIIMDVVFNHTCEGNAEGPTYSFKGIDNPSYYILDKDDKSIYENNSGCGNTLNLDSRKTLLLVLDSMRYFSQECKVDGFRFDLATSLLRDLGTLDKSVFLNTLRFNDSFKDLKLIAEPWDVGEKGYQLGRFRHKFCEWNDLFRGYVRSFWIGEENQLRYFSKMISGSEDIFKAHDNQSLSSINFITAHDGFTLQDLVSYKKKHNADNLENNLDGGEHNRSSNNGVEGPTKDKKINTIRNKQKKNLMAVNILSKGIPMILSGDEIGNSQKGNNNAYCQDNEIGWINWDKITKDDLDFYKFIKNLIDFKLKNKKLIIDGFWSDDNVKWLSTSGAEMTENDWEEPNNKRLSLVIGNKFIFMFNAHKEDIEFKLPLPITGTVLMNTSLKNSFKEDNVGYIASIKVTKRSMMIIKMS